MDPISLIEAALVAGATAAAQDTANQAVKDSYISLKTLLIGLFSNKPKAQEVLADHEEDPKVYELPLKKALTDVQAAQNTEIMALVQQILQSEKPHLLGLGKNTIQNNAPVYGQNIAEYQQITQHFGEPPKRG